MEMMEWYLVAVEGRDVGGTTIPSLPITVPNSLVYYVIKVNVISAGANWQKCFCS